MSPDPRSLIHFERISLPFPGVRSLVWQGDVLVDWAAGGRILRLDGSTQPGPLPPDDLDTAVVSPTGRFVVRYQRLGTRGQILDYQGRILRELGRDDYCSDAYEYPVALFCLANGVEVLAHCPHEYWEIVVEEAATGRPLTQRWAYCSGMDFFQSRLAADPSGRWLLSAGWFWSPFDSVLLYAVEERGNGEIVLARPEGLLELPAEVDSAAFAGSDRLVLAVRGDDGDKPEVAADDPNRLVRSVPWWPAGLLVFDLPRRQRIAALTLDSQAGAIMPVGRRHVVAFYETPRLIDLDTGDVVLRWPDLKTGRQISSIILNTETVPLALDPCGRRFAVADYSQVTVVTLSGNL